MIKFKIFLEIIQMRKINKKKTQQHRTPTYWRCDDDEADVNGDDADDDNDDNDVNMC